LQAKGPLGAHRRVETPQNCSGIPPKECDFSNQSKKWAVESFDRPSLWLPIIYEMDQLPIGLMSV
jgi:hypothetical protein